MIRLKTREEITIIIEAGKRLRKAVGQLLPEIKPGMTTEAIDEKAEKLIVEAGGEPAFKRVSGYNWTTCLPINEQVVHTPPGKRKVKNGDLLTIDIGLYYQGFNTDYATTLIVGDQKNERAIKFLETGKLALKRAITMAKVGNYLGQISQEIQRTIEGQGYFIMKQLTGHGIGRELHEEPYVLGYLDRQVEKTYRIKSGLVIAIEVIYAMGSEKIKSEKNADWSIISADRSLTACFEHTVALLDKNTLVLT